MVLEPTYEIPYANEPEIEVPNHGGIDIANNDGNISEKTFQASPIKPEGEDAMYYAIDFKTNNGKALEGTYGEPNPSAPDHKDDIYATIDYESMTNNSLA